MIYLFILAGAVLGVVLLESEGIIPGMLGGYLFFRIRESTNEMAHLSSKVRQLEEKLHVAEADSPDTSILAKDPAQETPPVPRPEEILKDPLFEPIPTPEVQQEQKDESLFEPVPAIETPVGEPVFSDTPPHSMQPNEFFIEKDLFNVWINKIKEFVLGGNFFGRLGIAVLFIGLSFLVKEAIKVGFFPIEIRLAAAFLIGAVLIFTGWRLTDQRPAYGLTLQGGGIAILYLTIFAGFRLYSLFDAQTALIFLVVITILGTTIAVLQNSQTLAVVSLLGGFLAPVVTSTGSGDHVALFSYYAVLNAGIFFMAWHKPWRAVHLTGFFSTFAIGTVWGGLSYNPSLFNSTEPFLILFFFIYFAISMMYALRHGLEPKKIVDGTLVFGLPVIAFALQAVLVEPYDYGLAWSALVMGGCYATTAWFINQRNPELLRTMIEALAGISLALISMTIPFALDATWTGTGWALEGAALIWLGINQKRLLVRGGGLLLIILASASFLQGLEGTSYQTFHAYRFILNPAFMGFLALSFSSFFAAYQIDKNKAQLFTAERFVSVILLSAGIIWWLFGGLEELRRELNDPMRQHVQIAFSAISAMCIALIGKGLIWTALQRSSLFLIPVLFCFLLLNLFTLAHPFVSWGSVMWFIAIGSMYVVLYFAEGTVNNDTGKDRVLGFAHAASLWLFTLLLTIECAWNMDQYFDYQTVWPALSVFMVPLLVIGVTCSLAPTSRWPFSTHKGAYLKTALIPVLLGVWCFSIFLSMEHAGNPAPLPYLPLLNPLDIMLGFAVFAALHWYKTINKEDASFLKPAGRQFLKWGLLVTGFIWMNATIGRSVHHWAGVTYGDALLESSAFQSAISICWTLLALSAMTYAARRGSRTPWFVSAALLAVVVLKLFVIDLSNLTTMHRVISFIGVGVLLLVIGYIAPVPPKTEEKLSEVTD